MREVKIIDWIRTGKQEKAFVYLYRYYPKVEKHICRNSGSGNEARDIFQEALIILYRKVTEGQPEKSLSCEGFLVNTCRNLWSNELRKKRVRLGNAGGLEHLVDVDLISDVEEREIKWKRMEQILHQLGDKCRAILEQFYFHTRSMDEIAIQFGFKTVESAKVQKYKCIELARKRALEQEVSNNLNQGI